MEASPVEPIEQPDLLCGGCGYNLRGVPSDRCPECGRQFDQKHLVSNLIPWEQRRHIGRFGRFVTFWRTAWIACQPRRLISYMDLPMSRSAARVFHFWVLLIAAGGIAAIPPIVMTLWPNLFRPGDRRGQIDELTAFVLNPEAAVITGLTLLAWLFTVTKLLGWFSQRRDMPPERRHRALAICDYASAPLIVIALTLGAACGVAALLVEGGWGRDAIDAVLILSQFLGIVAGVLAIAWLFIHRRHTGRQTARSHALLWMAGGVGAIASALAWTPMRFRYPGNITVTAESLRYVLTPIVLLPCIGLWIHAMRVLKLCCGYTTGQTLRTGVALLLCALALLVLLPLTAHAIYLVLSMLLVR